MEILESRETRPVPDDLRQQLVGPFIEAATVTMFEMAHAELVVRSVHATDCARTLGDLSAVIALKGEHDGELVLSVPLTTATAIAERVLAEVADAPMEELISDCLGEIANVVAGQAKSLLFGTPYHFYLGTPTVLSGAGQEIGRHRDAACLVVLFGSDLGDFAVQFCLDR